MNKENSFDDHDSLDEKYTTASRDAFMRCQLFRIEKAVPARRVLKFSAILWSTTHPGGLHFMNSTRGTRNEQHAYMCILLRAPAFAIIHARWNSNMFNFIKAKNKQDALNFKT
jgi:hypothetical protein